MFQSSVSGTTCSAPHTCFSSSSVFLPATKHSKFIITTALLDLIGRRPWPNHRSSINSTICMAHHFILTSRNVTLHSKCTRNCLFGTSFGIQQQDELHWNGREWCERCWSAFWRISHLVHLSLSHSTTFRLRSSLPMGECFRSNMP